MGFLDRFRRRHDHQPPDRAEDAVEPQEPSATMPGAPGTGEERILPVLKSRGWVRGALAPLAAQGLPREQLPYWEPFVGDLMLAFVRDTPVSMEYLSEPKVAAIERPRDRARADLMGLFQEQGAIEGGGGRFAVRLDGNYDHAMLLLIDVITGSLPVTGDPVIAVPDRSEFLVCGSADAAGVGELAAAARAMHAKAVYPVSPRLVVWREGRLSPLAG